MPKEEGAAIVGTTIFRVEKNREFVVMNNKFLREKGMSLKSKGLLALCLSLPENWNYSLNGLCAICKESQTSIRSALKELEQFGYLRRERKQDEKGQFQYEYILYELPHTGFTHTEEQHTEKAYTDDAHTENGRQQSIKKQSIDNKIIDKENKEKDIYSILDTSVFNTELLKLYKEYIEMRNSIEAPLTARGLKMLITRCERLSKDNIKVQKLMLENAILNGWKNIYLPHESEVAQARNEVVSDFKNLMDLE